MTLCGGYMQIFIGTLKWDFYCPKFWLIIYILNQACLEHAREISYSTQKDISNGVWQTLIKAYLAPTLKGFVVGSEIFNLNLNPSFDYNSCILGLHKQCKGILSNYILKHFQWYFGGPNWCSFALSIKVFEYIPAWMHELL